MPKKHTEQKKFPNGYVVHNIYNQEKQYSYPKDGTVTLRTASNKLDFLVKKIYNQIPLPQSIRNIIQEPRDAKNKPIIPNKIDFWARKIYNKIPLPQSIRNIIQESGDKPVCIGTENKLVYQEFRNSDGHLKQTIARGNDRISEFKGRFDDKRNVTQEHTKYNQSFGKNSGRVKSTKTITPDKTTFTMKFSNHPKGIQETTVTRQSDGTMTKETLFQNKKEINVISANGDIKTTQELYNNTKKKDNAQSLPVNNGITAPRIPDSQKSAPSTVCYNQNLARPQPPTQQQVAAALVSQPRSSGSTVSSAPLNRASIGASQR